MPERKSDADRALERAIASSEQSPEPTVVDPPAQEGETNQATEDGAPKEPADVELMKLRYIGNADSFRIGDVKFRHGNVRDVPKSDVERLLTGPNKRMFEVVEE